MGNVFDEPLDGTDILTLNDVRFPGECGGHCLQNPDCTSFHHNKDNALCVLVLVHVGVVQGPWNTQNCLLSGKEMDAEINICFLGSSAVYISVSI